jgi:hypothetical protein
MSALITAVVSMLSELLPLITSASNTTMIESIVNTLVGLIPFIEQEIQSLGPVVQNIIAALSANPTTTAAQLTTLQTLDAQVDAAFSNASEPTVSGQ